MSEMQYQVPGVSAETKALVDACGKNIRFQPLRYPHLGERPDWWLVRPEEIIEICRSVKKGRTEIIAESAAGLPVRTGIEPDRRRDFPIGIQIPGISLPVIRQR